MVHFCTLHSFQPYFVSPCCLHMPFLTRALSYVNPQSYYCTIPLWLVLSMPFSLLLFPHLQFLYFTIIPCKHYITSDVWWLLYSHNSFIPCNPFHTIHNLEHSSIPLATHHICFLSFLLHSLVDQPTDSPYVLIFSLLIFPHPFDFIHILRYLYSYTCCISFTSGALTSLLSSDLI